MESILKLEKVSYKYEDGNDYVFKDLDMEFMSGKIYSIKGKSGSGKTTLLSLISGLEEYKEGKILYKNQDLNKINKDKFRSSEIGIIFQAYNLLPHLNALENVVLSMDINKYKKDNKINKALECLEKVGLDKEKAKRRVLKLSGGEQQRVAIARSLSYNPEIILADEPTGNLDEETENEILNIFKDLAKIENKCIIIVTHSNNVCNKSDKVYDLAKLNKNKK